MGSVAAASVRRTAAGRPRSHRAITAPRALYVLSDSTGNLARHMIGAALTQFPANATRVVMETFIRTTDRLHAILERAAAEEAAICHALVSNAEKLCVARFCKRRKLPCYDLTGGLSNFIGQISGAKRSANVGALHRLDDAYKRRIGAIEFTLAHDDGLGLETLGGADIVLVGVSRTSKTPTSIYLAQQGYRVANIALAIEVDPPLELLRLPPQTVVGLLIDPQQLVLIRTHRERSWKSECGNYGDADHVAQELAWARKLYQRQGWKYLDVTDQAIEETAARILDMVKIRREPAASDSFSMME